MILNTLRIGIGVGLSTFPLFAQEPTLLLDLDRGQPPRILLKYGSFDPVTEAPRVPIILRGNTDTNLFIVQFASLPTDESRAAVHATGAQIHGYLPDHAYVVRMPHGVAARVKQLAAIRSVTYYHPAFRLESLLRLELEAAGIRDAGKTRRYNIVVVDKKSDKPALGRKISAIGGRIDDDMGGSLLFQATLSSAQLLRVARFDEVLWIDRWGAPELDMDNARIQGGANYIEAAGGYSGRGIIGHQYEGLNVSHRDWNNRPIGYPSSCASSSSHGHNTAGIVYGNGSSSPLARGMAPDAQAFFTSCRSNRWNNFNVLVNTHHIMFTTASWGSPRTRQYTSVSAEADDICFDHDLVWTNSQSNAGNQDSRAEAWAKNVFSCGGVRHRNNSNPNDDSWSGGASIGPAADGRIKPDFTAYYDGIATSSSNGGYTSGFGGTSGATPIVAGHNALAIQMFTDGVFGNTLRNPTGTRFENKPHFPTLKALQMANASQYPFTSSSTDNRREHQGWGFPNLRSMWDNRNVMFIVDEEDVIKQGGGMSYTLDVPAGRQELKVAMSFSDPAANPSAQVARINDLTVRVTAPNGTKYWGNFGLERGNYSITGGTRDRINTTENVIVRSPAAGNWTVDVIAYVVAQDSHVQTSVVDADFGLVVNGGKFISRKSITVEVGSITTIGKGCPGTATLPSTCASLNPNGGSLTRTTRSWEYAYQARSTTALQVTGFELWTSSTSSATINAPCAIYRASGNQPNNSPLARSTMTIRPTAGFYKATFSSPVNIPANTTFFVAVTHNNSTFISTVTGGRAGPGYYRSNSGWQLSGLATAPSYRILCQGGSQRAEPALAITGTPEIGHTLVETLTLAAPNATALMFVGASNTTWSGGTLPFDLAGLGAPGCSLYVSLNVAVPMRTNATGMATTQATIPNVTTLIGSSAFVQCVVDDPGANSFGAAFSNGVRVNFGG